MSRKRVPAAPGVMLDLSTIWAARAAVLLSALDLAAFAGLAAHAMTGAALADPDVRAVFPVADAPGASLGLLGFGTGLAYGVWPVGSIKDGEREERAGLMALCRIISLLHPLLLAWMAEDLYTSGRAAADYLFVFGSLCVLATPLLIPVIRGAQIWPGAQAARPRADGSGVAPPSTGQPSSPLVGVFLPFVATLNAGRPALATLSLVLWIGGFVLLFIAPLRAVPAFAAASAIGIRGVARPVADTPLAARSRSADVALGDWAIGGLLCVPVLFVSDAFAGAVVFGMQRAGTLEAWAHVTEGFVVVLIILTPLTLLPLMLVLPLRARWSEVLRKAVTLGLAISQLLLLTLFVGISFRLPAFDAAYAPLVSAMLRPLAWAMLALSPLALIAGRSAWPDARAWS